MKRECILIFQQRFHHLILLQTNLIRKQSPSKISICFKKIAPNLTPCSTSKEKKMLKRRLKMQKKEEEETGMDEGSQQFEADLSESSSSESDSYQSASEDQQQLQQEQEENSTNKKRLMILPSRGLGFRFRHFMLDLAALLPHSKRENKLDTKNQLGIINEVCDLEDCDYVMFLEGRRSEDLYMWLSDASSDGPSAKFYVQNVHTAGELNMKGNCARKSRGIVSFSPEFDDPSIPHLSIVKRLLEQTFSIPQDYPKINPYYDHVINFSYLDGRIWYRNYQIDEQPVSGSTGELGLLEIGPRFCMQVVKIHERSFSGPIVFKNEQFVSPNEIRNMAKQHASSKYVRRINEEKASAETKQKLALQEDELDTMFHHQQD